MAAATVLAAPSYYPAANERIRLGHAADTGPAFNAAGPPPGFPEKLYGPLVWNKEDMLDKSDEWIVQLSESDAEAVEKALRFFQSELAGSW